MTQPLVRLSMLLLVGGSMLTAPAAIAGKHAKVDRLNAQNMFKGEVKLDVQDTEEVEIARELDTLPSDIAPPDLDVADTVLLFTNFSNYGAAVKCVGFDRNGTPIGRTLTRIPRLGVRYVLASDISNGLDFIGHVQCAKHGRVEGTALFIGPGVTDLPVLNRGVKNRIRFPVVAHY